MDFENVGKKVQALAKTIFALGIISGLVVAVIMLCLGASTGSGIPIFIGLLCCAFIILSSWISAIVTYAIGETNEKVLMLINKKEPNEPIIKNSKLTNTQANPSTIKPKQQTEQDTEQDKAKKTLEIMTTYKQLLNDGIITQNEYDQKLAKIRAELK